MTSTRRSERTTRTSQWWAVLAVVVLLLTLSAVLLPWALAERPGPMVREDSWSLLLAFTLLFALAEVCVLHIQVKREAQTLALNELPLVLALTFIPDWQLAVSMVAGAVLAYVFHRRQRGLKLAYNASLKAADAAVTLAVYHVIAGQQPVLTAPWMIGCYAAVAAVALMDGVTTQTVIGLHERSLSTRGLLTDIAVYPALALGVATIAMLISFAFAGSALSAVPAALAGICVFVSYRAYSSLADRHLGLERLYRFSQAVTSTPEGDETLAQVLTQAKELLRSEHVEITFFSGRPGEVVRVGLDASAAVQRRATTLPADDPHGRLEPSPSAPVLMTRSGGDPMRRLLEERGWEEAIVVPLRGDAGVIGTLTVADRMGQVRGFNVDDTRLLETVANHAGVALEKDRLIDQLRHESLHDALTGLPNRVLLRSSADAELESLLQGASPGCAVMIMDLDGFKEVNDTLGHQTGDVLLRVVAARTVQAAGPTVTVARLGGDEFALLVPSCADPASAAAVAESVLTALAEPTTIDGIAVHVGASIGVAVAPLHAADATGLLRYADIAMYAAKAGGGGVQVYEAESDTSSPDRLAMAMELRHALDNGEMRIHVQPKARLDTSAVSSVEVLARWHHPRHGLIPPDVFIPLAERSGLMGPLTELVLDRALEACAGWLADGVEMNMAVNLSPRSLADDGLCATVARLLARRDVPARLLTLEITETTVMADPEASVLVLDQLRLLGVRVSVDDFGVGYSSLASLNRMPVQELKIDRSFVLALGAAGGRGDSEVIIRAIIDLGRSLSLDVVAEGVEDLAVWDQLAAMGCQQAQGYYIARPMDPSLFVQWLRSDHGVSVPPQRRSTDRADRAV